jgi:hypothetical protein
LLAREADEMRLARLMHERDGFRWLRGRRDGAIAPAGSV